MDRSNDDVAQYVAPPSLKFIGKTLSFREDRSVVSLFQDNQQVDGRNGDEQVQVQYIKGLVGIAVCLVSFWMLWLLILALLKCGGGVRVGCSAGWPFRSWQRPFFCPENEDSTNNSKSGYRYQYRYRQPRRSKNAEVSTRNPELDGQREHWDGVWRLKTIPDGAGHDDDMDEDVDSFDDEIVTTSFSVVTSKTALTDWTHKIRSACCGASPDQVERRKRRTRCVYFGTFLLVELTGVLLFLYLCRPLEDISIQAESVITKGQSIYDRVDQSLTKIQETLVIVDRLIEKTPLESDTICRNNSILMLDAQVSSSLFGSDFHTVLDFLATDYPAVLKTVQADLDAGSATVDLVGQMLSKWAVFVNEADAKLWIPPFVVLSSMLVNWIFGMLFAVAVCFPKGEESASFTSLQQPSQDEKLRWKYNSEFILNRVLLPLATVLATLLFFLAVLLLMGGAVASDSCMAGEDQSPDATVEAIIHQGPSSAPHTIWMAYTIEGCHAKVVEDPVENFKSMEQLLEVATQRMDQWIQQAYQSGLAQLAVECGKENRILDFFDGVFLLQVQLYNTQAFLRDIDDALSCPAIHGLYVDTVHDLGCSQFAASLSNGCIWMFIHATASLVLVSLRAAWQ